MSDSNEKHSPNAPRAAALEAGLSPLQQLRGKRIAYLTLPLLVMATVVEYVILATGWKYQQTVCVPQGMGVTFFGIGPIGATILAVELLKLPLAIWTASRVGWTKRFMIFAGLPLICVLTFQLVKDMAVYEMGVAMKPASEMLEKASAEEIKMAQLKGELAAIEAKKTERQSKLAELTTKKAKAKAELEEALKRIDETRQDAITLTDYQKKELAEEESRQAAITKQFNADSEQLTKALAELRARREVELPSATKWSEEEARIENAYKTKLSAYTNKKTAYEKAKAEYESASFVMRQLMREPVDPGVPPEREVNKILKPTTLMELEAQIKAKEAELLAVNNKRRERIAQVGDGAQRLRQEFDTRSRSKREEADRKRDELLAAHTALTKEWNAEEKQMDAELAAAVQSVGGLRAEVDASRKVAEKHYEAREAAIRGTQVHRIATTVEIVRGLLFGERPMSITASAKERGDVLTDQISMVRIWVYPVLAFIVAFLPTLMVEIGFSTAFHPDPLKQQRPPHRLGFLGQRMHQLYIRAGRQKILRAERKAAQATGELAARDRALATAKTTAAQALAEKEVELEAARDALSAATNTHEEQLAWMAADYTDQIAGLQAERDEQVDRLKTDRDEQAKRFATEHAAQMQQASDNYASLLRRLEAERNEQVSRMAAEHEDELKQKEAGWVTKFSSLAESLSRAAAEKDALRESQHAEVERQVQLRQGAWSERVNELRQQLDTQHTAHETERAALIQEHHQKLRETSESAKTQVAQARRQAADAELAAQEATARLTFDLKQAQEDREAARVQLLQQTESLTLKLSQAREEAAREVGQALRDEKYRSERLQLEFDKTLRERNDEFARQLKQREQELALEAETRLAKERELAEQDARRRDAEFERQLEAKTREVDARWTQELQQREEAVQVRLKQQEQQLQAQAAQDLRRREAELQRQLDTQTREADARVKQEVLQRELALQAKFKQREQELAAKAVARETELQNQAAEDLRSREQEWERQAEARVRATETRLAQEARQKEELLEIKNRQREQQLQAEFEARQSEWQTETQHFHRRHQEETASATQRALRELEVQLRQEMQQKETATQAKARQREQELLAQLAAQNQSYKQAQHQWETELLVMRRNIEPLNALLARTTKERDEAKQSATEHFIKVQDMEKKLTEASSLLTGWKVGNGKHSDSAKAGRDVLQASRAVMTGDNES